MRQTKEQVAPASVALSNGLLCAISWNLPEAYSATPLVGPFCLPRSFLGAWACWPLGSSSTITLVEEEITLVEEEITLVEEELPTINVVGSSTLDGVLWVVLSSAFKSNEIVPIFECMS